MNINNFKTKERFSRNIIIESVGIKGQQLLFEKKVLIAGAGGLGSGVISGLTAVGVGKLGIIDYDKVELSNLNRQFIHPERNICLLKVESAFEWIKSFSPETHVDIFTDKLEENRCYNYFSNYDLVIDCFDSFRSKFLLNKICFDLEKPLIHGGVEEFFGQVITIIPGKSACLSCIFNDPDFKSNVVKGVLSPTVNIISSLQVMEAVKYFLGIKNLLTNTLLIYNGLENDFKKVHIPKNSVCLVCA